MWGNANHLIWESDLISLSSVYFMRMFIVSLPPSPSLCHPWHLVRMLTLWQYMGLNILTWNIARVNRLSGEESPDWDKQIALVKQIKHWQARVLAGWHLTVSPQPLCVSCLTVSVPETFPEFVTRGHHHISHHIDFLAPQPFSQSQANFYYILSNTGSSLQAKHVSVSKSLSLYLVGLW